VETFNGNRVGSTVLESDQDIWKSKRTKIAIWMVGRRGEITSAYANGQSK
jgi:hypothetical protein